MMWLAPLDRANHNYKNNLVIAIIYPWATYKISCHEKLSLFHLNNYFFVAKKVGFPEVDHLYFKLQRQNH